tara:strand:+ start:52 stop:576 length:525 start_codon:yes stop_codon:yes gene_type:complete
MIRKVLVLNLLLLISSCFSNKIKEIKDFSFEKLIVNENISQVNSSFLEGIDPKDFKEFLLKNNFTNSNDLNEFIFNETEANFRVIIDSKEKIQKIEFYSYSEVSPLKKAQTFFKQASKIPIPQVDTLRIKKWTEANMKLINEKFSRATILSNIHYIIEQIDPNEFRLTIKKYNN